MEKIDLLVSAPHFFTMEGEGVGYRPNTAMAVDRGKILAIGPRKEILNLYRGHRTIDAESQAVLPGFIDAHMHMTLCGLRGLAQDTGYWMMYGLAPFSHHLDEPTGITGAQLAVIEAVRAGTTTFGEFGRRPDLLIPFFEKVGIRAQITVTIREAVERLNRLGRRELGEKLVTPLRWEVLEPSTVGETRWQLGHQLADFTYLGTGILHQDGIGTLIGGNIAARG